MIPRGASMRGAGEGVKRPAEMSGRTLLTLLLAAAFLWSLLAVEWGGRLVHPGGGASLVKLLAGMMRPALSPSLLWVAAEASWRTLAYATAGMSVAVALAVPLGVAASGVLSSRRWAKRISSALFRGILGFLRAIHELVWAWLFVAAFGLSPIAAVLALGLPYGGILGRILADMLVDVPEEPLRALRSSGASELKVLLYGRLPLAFADMVSYTLYRYECAIRSASIMSFVGLGGLGYQIQLSLDDLKYGEVTTFLLFLIGMVVLVDAWSSRLRRRLVA